MPTKFIGLFIISFFPFILGAQQFEIQKGSTIRSLDYSSMYHIRLMDSSKKQTKDCCKITNLEGSIVKYNRDSFDIRLDRMEVHDISKNYRNIEEYDYTEAPVVRRFGVDDIDKFTVGKNQRSFKRAHTRDRIGMALFISGIATAINAAFVQKEKRVGFLTAGAAQVIGSYVLMSFDLKTYRFKNVEDDKLWWFR